MNTIHQLSVGRLLVNLPKGASDVKVEETLAGDQIITYKIGKYPDREPLPPGQWSDPKLCSELSEEEIQECTALGYDPTTTYLLTDKTQVI